MQAPIIYQSSCEGAAPTCMCQCGQSQKKCNQCKGVNAFYHAHMLTSLPSADKLNSSLTTIRRSPTGFRGDPYHLGNARKRKYVTCSRISANIQVCLPLQVHCMLPMPTPAMAALPPCLHCRQGHTHCCAIY